MPFTKTPGKTTQTLTGHIVAFCASPRAAKIQARDSSTGKAVHSRWTTMASAEPCKDAAKPPFNFGVTTDAETLVCGSARPGAKQQRCYAEDLRVPANEVQEWVMFMQAAGVQSVVSMLSPSELETYAEPLPSAMEAAFGPGNYINIDAKAPGSSAKILSAVQSGRDAGKKVLVHCWGGGGRTGLVQAAWLAVSKGLSPEQAAEAVTAYASSKGLSRRVDTEALNRFLADAGVH